MHRTKKEGEEEEAIVLITERTQNSAGLHHMLLYKATWFTRSH
jgi:hypothetical protein